MIIIVIAIQVISILTMIITTIRILHQKDKDIKQVKLDYVKDLLRIQCEIQNDICNSCKKHEMSCDKDPNISIKNHLVPNIELKFCMKG